MDWKDYMLDEFSMGPYEAEYLAKEEPVTINPRGDSTEDLGLASCGLIQRWRKAEPCNVPLWVALELKERQMCTLIPPPWLRKDILTQIWSQEKATPNLLPLTFYWQEIAKAFLLYAGSDLGSDEERSELTTLIRSIEDVRGTKITHLCTNLDEGAVDDVPHLLITNLTSGEIIRYRKYFTTQVRSLLQVHNAFQGQYGQHRLEDEKRHERFYEREKKRIEEENREQKKREIIMRRQRLLQEQQENQQLSRNIQNFQQQQQQQQQKQQQDLKKDSQSTNPFENHNNNNDGDDDYNNNNYVKPHRSDRNPTKSDNSQQQQSIKRDAQTNNEGDEDDQIYIASKSSDHPYPTSPLRPNQGHLQVPGSVSRPTVLSSPARNHSRQAGGVGTTTPNAHHKNKLRSDNNNNNLGSDDVQLHNPRHMPPNSPFFSKGKVMASPMSSRLTASMKNADLNQLQNMPNNNSITSSRYTSKVISQHLAELPPPMHLASAAVTTTNNNKHQKTNTNPFVQDDDDDFASQKRQGQQQNNNNNNNNNNTTNSNANIINNDSHESDDVLLSQTYQAKHRQYEELGNDREAALDMLEDEHQHFSQALDLHVDDDGDAVPGMGTFGFDDFQLPTSAAGTGSNANVKDQEYHYRRQDAVQQPVRRTAGDMDAPYRSLRPPQDEQARQQKSQEEQQQQRRRQQDYNSDDDDEGLLDF